MIIALKTIREAKGISVDDLAEKTGLTKMKIWNYESGRNQPDPETLCKLADALDVSLDMLVRGKEKDRLDGRSLDGVFKEYKSKSLEELEYFHIMLQAVIADKRFQDHLRQDGKETP